MAISTTQGVPLQVAPMLRRVFSPVEIAQSLLTEVFNHAGQKSDLMCTICGNLAALMVIIFSFFPSRFPISICRPTWPDFAFAKRIIAFFAHNAGSTSHKQDWIRSSSFYMVGKHPTAARGAGGFSKKVLPIYDKMQYNNGVVLPAAKELRVGKTKARRSMMRRGTPAKRTKYSVETVCLGLAFIVVSLAGSPALALDPMGPPASALWKGDYRVGLDYSLSEMDLELTDGTLTGVGKTIDLTLKDFQAHRAYATLGYGLSDNWEGFLRLGGANGTFGDTIWNAGEELEGGIDFAAGAGIKATFYETDLWRFGALLQAGYAEFDGTLESGVSGWLPDFTEVDILQIQAALGATYRWTDRLSIYAGPFAYMLMGDFEDTFPLTGESTIVSTYHWDLDSGLNFGGYLGANFMLRENCACNIEYQIAGNASTIGLGLMWKI